MLTPNEQETLFRRVRKRFKNRPAKWCSGYVHGIMDEAKHEKPDPTYLGRTRYDYNMGYLWGFLDARGSDAFEWDWARRLTPSRKALQFEWYK